MCLRFPGPHDSASIKNTHITISKEPWNKFAVDLDCWQARIKFYSFGFEGNCMHYRQLGRTGLQVSVIGLGTMTWGEQNSEAEAHAQLDAAFDAGVNLIDTAEMYPVPPKQETYGLTETYIGNWLAATGRRHKGVLVTKDMSR